MKWIAWALQAGEVEKEWFNPGEFVCGGHALVALVAARKKYGSLVVDHVQSVLSYEVEVLEKQGRYKLLMRQHHPRRKPKKQPLDDAGILHNIMGSGNTYQQVAGVRGDK